MRLYTERFLRHTSTCRPVEFDALGPAYIDRTSWLALIAEDRWMGPPGFEFPGISLPGSHGHARGWVRPHRAVRPTRLDYGPLYVYFLYF